MLCQDTQAALWTQRWAIGHQSELPGVREWASGVSGLPQGSGDSDHRLGSSRKQLPLVGRHFPPLALVFPAGTKAAQNGRNRVPSSPRALGRLRFTANEDEFQAAVKK